MSKNKTKNEDKYRYHAKFGLLVGYTVQEVAWCLKGIIRMNGSREEDFAFVEDIRSELQVSLQKKSSQENVAKKQKVK